MIHEILIELAAAVFAWHTRDNMLACHSSYDFCVASEAATLTISTLLAFRGWCLNHYQGKISHPSQAAVAMTRQCQGGCKKVTDGWSQSPALHHAIRHSHTFCCPLFLSCW